MADADLLLHVVDASDPARDVHIETTETLLGELGLGEIPRILVYNKIDQVNPYLAKVLSTQGRDVVCVSATHRETTRALLDRIAERLRDRWEAAALQPPLPPLDPGDLDVDGVDVVSPPSVDAFAS